MTQEKEHTRVIFRIDTGGESKDEVTAWFPDGDANLGYMPYYAHIGQHGEGDYVRYLDYSRPATPSEYMDLYTELKNIGYDDLKIVTKNIRK